MQRTAEKYLLGGQFGQLFLRVEIFITPTGCRQPILTLSYKNGHQKLRLIDGYLLPGSTINLIHPAHAVYKETKIY